MRIYLNNFLLNDVSNRTYLDEPIEGLDTPDIRTSKGSNTGQSGGYIGAQFYGSRSVTLNGRVFSSDITEALQKRRSIQSSLPIHPAVISVRVEADDGRSYIFNAYLIDFKMPITRGLEKHAFKIELEAPDPVIYDNTAGSSLTATVNQVVPGGVQFTDVDPLFDTFYFSAGQSDVTVTNTSDLISYPVITISGAINNPVLTNKTTGDYFQLNGYVVGADAVTIIDMGQHTVTLNGSNVFAYAPTDVDWWGLVPGSNQIAFSSGGGTDSTQATLSWRPGYRGI